MTTDLQTYTQRLLLALRLHDVPGPQIAEALAQVQSHVAETGEDPVEAFGTPQSYADALVEALADRSASDRAWWRGTSAVALVYGLGAYAGAWLLLDAVLDLAAGKSGLIGLPPVAWMLVGTLVLGALAIGLFRMGLSDSVPVLHPRTGKDMVAPVPRWVMPVMVGTPLLGLGIALVVAIAAR